jgi:hypothetical protein
MIKHYLKIAFRNMWKYKWQTFVSVVGLAVGFTCFAMAVLWIRYETTYDSFHKNADRIYSVYIPDPYSPIGITSHGSYPMAGYLKKTFPEIKHSTSICNNLRTSTITYGDTKCAVKGIEIDSSFFSMFDVKIIEGNMDFLIDRTKLAITEDKARQIFGNESPVGKEVTEGRNRAVICAVVTGWSGRRSNYSFDFLRLMEPYSWDVSLYCDALIELYPGVDVKAFRKKLGEHVVRRREGSEYTNISIIPVTEVYYKDPYITRDVQFEYVVVFAVAGSLLILCTLFNYLTLFISRFRLRQKELALRTVYGASGWSLFAMLSVEFVISLVVALALGLGFIDLVNPSFRAVSKVNLEVSAIFFESIIYLVAIIAVSLTVFFLTLAVFKRRTLNARIRSNKKMFRKTSITAQLTVSIIFAFCALIILKQMYHLRNTDLGFAFKNRGLVYVPTDYNNIKMLNDKIKQIPEIEETLSGYLPLLPERSNGYHIYNWDGKPENANYMETLNVCISEQFIKYYELKLSEGEFLDENGETNEVMINESLMKILGWDKAAGKSLNGKRVKGVVKNTYNWSPTISAKPVCYTRPTSYRDRRGNMRREDENPYILLKYNEGTWKTCRDKIQKIITEELPNIAPQFYNSKEEYNKFLKAENALFSILTVVAAVCMIVCVFGFVSIVSLTCEERRKEIAIRKINGATVKDILDIFFKEHLALLAVGALIAFPAGYIVMKRWLENYVVQTEINAWVYLSILLALFMAIVLCVGGRVYKTSCENPVDSIKS